MNTPTEQFPKNDNIPESSPCHEATVSTTNKPDDSDLLNHSAFRRDSGSRLATKKVKIADPKQNVEGDSDEEYSISLPNTCNIPELGESVSAVNCGQANDQQAASAASIDRKKTKEKQKKEREKKKEEETLKKYQVEQEAKQKISA
uniref:Uncharacterized protein n=1 Tax=Trichobilharzia regenti TaxID=157069 RepID=A0AA85ITX7_TRIRE|nr:unnamed protein product [Trichobilharzia regenti]